LKIKFEIIDIPHITDVQIQHSKFYSILICFTVCKTDNHGGFDTVKDSNIINKVIKVNTTSVLDTTVKLRGIYKSSYRGSELNDSLAKMVLYEQFIKRGFWTVDNLPNASTMDKENKEKLCVEFTSIFKINLIIITFLMR
jgi:hypothetical protein